MSLRTVSFKVLSVAEAQLQRFDCSQSQELKVCHVIQSKTQDWLTPVEILSHSLLLRIHKLYGDEAAWIQGMASGRQKASRCLT